MKNLSFLFLLSLLTLLSCRKEPKTHISGQVVTFGTEDPVIDAKLVLYGGTSDGNFSNPGASMYRIDSTYTDAKGFYEFNFDTGDYSILDVVAEKESYFSKSVQQGLIPGGENVADIELEPFAWIKLHVKNVMPTNVDDGIIVGSIGGGGGILNTGGENVDEMIIIKVVGNKEHKINWQVLTNDTYTFQEFLYCPAQDTTLFEIFY